MNVLLYSRAFFPQLGGIERASMLLATELARRGHSVRVATRVAASPGQDRPLPFEVVRGSRAGAFRQAARAADLVHTNGYSLEAVALAARNGRPCVVTHAGFQACCLEGSGLHGDARCGLHLARCVALTSGHLGLARATRQLARHLAGRLGLHAVRANVAVSQAVATAIRAPRTTVIWNCVDTAIFCPGLPGGDRSRLLFAGRLVHEKGVDVLLEAIALDRAAGGPLALDLAGSGPLAPLLIDRCRALGIQERVRFLGPLGGPALAQAMRDSAAVVVPSRSEEAFGLTAAEALCTGRLALVSDRGGLPEVVAGGGLVLPAEDPGAWRDAMVQATLDTAWRHAREEGLAGLPARFGLERHVDAYLDVYRAAVR